MKLKLPIEVSVEQRVQNGIDYLDIHKPDWNIDLNNFKIGHSCKCVLGQNFGNYFQAIVDLQIEDDAWMYGFTVSPDDYYAEDIYPWDILAKEWIRRLTMDLKHRSRQS